MSDLIPEAARAHAEYEGDPNPTSELAGGPETGPEMAFTGPGYSGASPWLYELPSIEETPEQALHYARMRYGRREGPMTATESVLRDQDEQRRTAATERTRAAVAQLDTLTDPVARLVLDMHGRDSQWGHCSASHCSADHDERAMDWPCETTKVIADHYGIDLTGADRCDWTKVGK